MTTCSAPKPSVTVFIAPNNNRSRIVGEAIFAGIKAAGWHVEKRSSRTYDGIPQGIAVFYGLAEGLRRVFDDHRRAGRAIFIDLGYWGRRKRTRWDGYHKMVLNARHPTEYFQARPHSADRFSAFGLEVKPWRKSGDRIVVAGMSAKAAAAEGLGCEQWERETIAQLRQITTLPIVYRPKPNCPMVRPIHGSVYETGIDIEQSLRGAHAVVTHHSNVAVDALLAGVPVFCPFGAASVLAEPDLANIDNPRMPDGREQWAADLAYCQFSVEEMASGAAWRMLRAEGLLG